MHTTAFAQDGDEGCAVSAALELDEILRRLEIIHNQAENMADRAEAIEKRFFGPMPKQDNSPEVTIQDTCLERLQASLAYIRQQQARLDEALENLERL